MAYFDAEIEATANEQSDDLFDMFDNVGEDISNIHVAGHNMNEELKNHEDNMNDSDSGDDDDNCNEDEDEEEEDDDDDDNDEENANGEHSDDHIMIMTGNEMATTEPGSVSQSFEFTSSPHNARRFGTPERSAGSFQSGSSVHHEPLDPLGYHGISGVGGVGGVGSRSSIVTGGGGIGGIGGSVGSGGSGVHITQMAQEARMHHVIMSDMEYFEYLQFKRQKLREPNKEEKAKYEQFSNVRKLLEKQHNHSRTRLSYYGKMKTKEVEKMVFWEIQKNIHQIIDILHSKYSDLKKCLTKIDEQLNKEWYNNDDFNCSIPQAQNKLNTIQSMNDGINNFILLQQKSIRQFDLDIQNIFTNMNNHLKSVLTMVKKLKFNVQNSSTVENKNNNNNSNNSNNNNNSNPKNPNATTFVFTNNKQNKRLINDINNELNLLLNTKYPLVGIDSNLGHDQFGGGDDGLFNQSGIFDDEKESKTNSNKNKSKNKNKNKKGNSQKDGGGAGGAGGGGGAEKAESKKAKKKKKKKDKKEKKKKNKNKKQAGAGAEEVPTPGGQRLGQEQGNKSKAFTVKFSAGNRLIKRKFATGNENKNSHEMETILVEPDINTISDTLCRNRISTGGRVIISIKMLQNDCNDVRFDNTGYSCELSLIGINKEEILKKPGKLNSFLSLINLKNHNKKIKISEIFSKKSIDRDMPKFKDFETLSLGCFAVYKSKKGGRTAIFLSSEKAQEAGITSSRIRLCNFMYRNKSIRTNQMSNVSLNKRQYIDVRIEKKEIDIKDSSDSGDSDGDGNGGGDQDIRVLSFISSVNNERVGSKLKEQKKGIFTKGLMDLNFDKYLYYFAFSSITCDCPDTHGFEYEFKLR